MVLTGFANEVFDAEEPPLRVTEATGKLLLIAEAPYCRVPEATIQP